MRRRALMFALAGAAVWPLAPRAQQAMPVIGFLNPGLRGRAYFVAAFQQGLKETGHVDGQNVSIEYRWAEAQYDQLPAMAADLVRHQAAVIAATGGTFSGLTAKQATSTIPIVFIGTVDPVSLGLVASLNRPGGNVTGVYLLAAQLLAKRFELLAELIPKEMTIGALVNPTNPTAKIQVPEIQEAARSFGRQFVIVNATSEGELGAAFVGLVQQRVGGVVITSDTFFNNQRSQLAALTVHHAMPAIFEQREFAVAGGLMSYGTNIAEGYRQVGIYTGRILKGEKPADLPIQQSTKVELIINLKTARALGLEIPPALLARADEVIE
jgi:putative tryptophan/tyrosine transport system substrate-binding protein